MDREKLNKAAEEGADARINEIELHSDYVSYLRGFNDGADWLMQLPLLERLTDEEKEKIKSIYKWATECNDDNEEAAVTKTVLENIFGADLFK